MIDKDFWETKHTVNDAGNNSKRLMDFFNLSTYSIINKKVLGVGIGLELAKLRQYFGYGYTSVTQPARNTTDEPN